MHARRVTARAGTHLEIHFTRAEIRNKCLSGVFSGSCAMRIENRTAVRSYLLYEYKITERHTRSFTTAHHCIFHTYELQSPRFSERSRVLENFHFGEIFIH